MNFLKEYGFEEVDINEFLENTPEKIKEAIKTHEKLVRVNIEYLKNLGVITPRFFKYSMFTLTSFSCVFIASFIFSGVFSKNSLISTSSNPYSFKKFMLLSLFLLLYYLQEFHQYFHLNNLNYR